MSSQDDIIYPVHKFDDNNTLRGIVVTWTLRFDAVLDHDKLHRSFWRLLEIGDWRKLGGRLRLTRTGRLEIYAPRVFTDARPPVTFTRRRIVTSIKDDALAGSLPVAPCSSIFQPGPSTFGLFAADENAPRVLNDYLQKDIPQIALQITSFQDATLVALSWPHTLMDVMGQKALVHAWSLVVNGRESEVPPLLGAHEDIVERIANVSRDTNEPFSLQALRLRGLGIISFGLRFVWRMFREPKVEERTFYLSKRDVEVLMGEAREDLDRAQNNADQGAGMKPFISEGDVLTAFFVRVVARALPTPQPITALHALNLRFRIPEFVNAAGVYVQNMAIGAFLLLSSTAATGSLGSIALENRRSLAAQATPSQLLSYVREVIPADSTTKANDPATILFGPADALLVPFTNWTRAEFASTIDFSGACVHTAPAEDSRKSPTPPGHLVYHHASSRVPSPGARNVFVLLGDDHAGNRWVTATLLPDTWTSLEEELIRLRTSSLQ